MGEVGCVSESGVGNGGVIVVTSVQAATYQRGM